MRATVFAQSPASTEKRRPTVGLALEGGGALGLAHVGLLEWFYEHHIPVDYIAGSSMGGLVAGFYASGMSPSEMHKTVDELDWNALVNGEPDDRKLAFRRKEDTRTFGNNLVFGLRHGLFFPSGLNSGQGLELLLSKITLPYGRMNSFDDLPTPFRSLATDLVSGRAEVFEQGSLAKALRATMSIPGLFDPVLDGKSEFVDGGLLNNLPVDLVKKMGADIVIAVYLGTAPFDSQRPHTLFNVLGRSLSVVMAANEVHNIEAADLLVSIDLSGFTSTDFEKYQHIITLGHEGAQKKERVLSQFALDDTSWTAYLAERQKRRKTDVPPPQFVEVEGIQDPGLASTIRSYFVDEIGKPFDPHRTEAQIQKITSVSVFAFLAYEIVERNGQTGLIIRARISSSRPPILQPAFLIDGSDYRNSRFTAAARLTALDFGGFRSEWRNDFQLGSTYRVASEYFHPFRATSPWFIAPRAYASTQPLDFYRRNRLLSLYRMREAGGGADLGYSLSNIGELRVGYESSYQVSTFRLGDSSLFPIVRGRYGATRASFTLDRLDNEIVPSRGILARSTFRAIDANPGSTDLFPALDANVEVFHPLPGKSTGFLQFEGGTILGQSNHGLPIYFLGGPQRLSAYGMNELYGNNYLFGRAGYLKQLAVLSPFTGSKAYFVFELEAGKMYGFANSTLIPFDATTGLYVKSLLGPVFVGGSLGDSGHRKIFFQIGRFF